MAVPKRFAVVRFFGVFMKIVAWIVLVLSIIGAVGVVLLGQSSFMANFVADTAPFLDEFMNIGIATSAGILGALALIIGGIINFLLLYLIGESFHMILAVEENTRLTAALLLRMHQESRLHDEQAAYGDTGFSDAYE